MKYICSYRHTYSNMQKDKANRTDRVDRVDRPKP